MLTFLFITALVTTFACPLTEDEVQFYIKYQLLSEYDRLHQVNTSLTALTSEIQSLQSKFDRRLQQSFADGGNVDNADGQSSALQQDIIESGFVSDSDGTLITTEDQALLVQIIEKKIIYWERQSYQSSLIENLQTQTDTIRNSYSFKSLSNR